MIDDQRPKYDIRHDARPITDETFQSLDEKRKSVEDKLNAVFEKRISMDSGKRFSDHASVETLKRVSRASTISQNSEMDVPKSGSAVDIRSDISVRTTQLKNLSQDSLSNESRSRSGEIYRGTSPDRKKESIGTGKTGSRTSDTVDRSVNIHRRGSSAGTGVSVVTSTPVKSQSISRSGSGDNVVVVTGKKFVIIYHFSNEYIVKKNNLFSFLR